MTESRPDPGNSPPDKWAEPYDPADEETQEELLARLAEEEDEGRR